MRIVFWNTNKNENINEYISDIIVEQEIDILALAEYESDIEELKKMLALYNIVIEQAITIGCDRITILKRKENILISFYTFLNKKKILTNKDAIVEHKVVPIKNRGNVTSKGKRVSISPFKDSLEYKVFYPPTNPTNSYGRGNTDT